MRDEQNQSLIDQLFTLRRRLRENVYYVKAMRYVRMGILYAVFALTLFLSCTPFQKEFEIQFVFVTPLKPYIGGALELLMQYGILYSLFLTFAIFDRSSRMAFLEEHFDDFDPFEEQRILLHSKDFWLELAVVWVLFLLQPISDLRVGLFRMIPTWDAWFPFLQKLLLFVPFAPLTLYFSLYSRLKADRVWITAPRELNETKLWKSLEDKLNAKYSKRRFVGRVALYSGLYILVGFVGAISVAIIYSLLQTAVLLAVELYQITTVLFVILLLLLLSKNYIRALFKRRKFVRNLKKTCREYGFELFDTKNIYRSCFFESRKHSFGVIANGKRFYCRIVAGVRRATELYLRPDGMGERHFCVRLYMPAGSAIGMHVRMSVNSYKPYIELFRHVREFDYTFETDESAHKVLILNPVPQRTYIKQANNTSQACDEMDNGMNVGTYKCYGGTGFINALIRDCVEKQDQYDKNFHR